MWPHWGHGQGVVRRNQHQAQAKWAGHGGHGCYAKTLQTLFFYPKNGTETVTDLLFSIIITFQNGEMATSERLLTVS